MRPIFYVIPLLVTFILQGCTQQSTCPPNYVFKKGEDDSTAAKMGDFEISRKTLHAGIESELYEAKMKVYELKMNRLQAIVVEKLMNEDPRKAGLTNDQYLEQFILGDAMPTEREIQDFISQRNIPQEHVNDDMRERIRQYLSMEKKRVMIDEWVGVKTTDRPVEVFFERPSRPVFDVQIGDSPYKGPSNAPITIVEFSDFQCPFCGEGSRRMEEVLKKYGRKVRLVYKNFPLPFHQNAHTAAQAAFCAKEEGDGKYWELHKLMFADQQNLGRPAIAEKAKSIGLNIEKFEACLNEGRYRARVDQDVDQGRELGVQSTPTYFINGVLIAGAQPLAAFSEIIDELLQQQ